MNIQVITEYGKIEIQLPETAKFIVFVADNDIISFEIIDYIKKHLSILNRRNQITDKQRRNFVLEEGFGNSLSPKLAIQKPKVAMTTHPKKQFIISTNNPCIFLGLPPDKTVIYKVEITLKQSNLQYDIKVRLLDINLANLSANLILSEIFGMENVFSIYQKDFSEIPNKD